MLGFEGNTSPDSKGNFNTGEVMNPVISVKWRCCRKRISGNFRRWSRFRKLSRVRRVWKSRSLKSLHCVERCFSLKALSKEATFSLKYVSSSPYFSPSTMVAALTQPQVSPLYLPPPKGAAMRSVMSSLKPNSFRKHPVRFARSFFL